MVTFQPWIYRTNTHTPTLTHAHTRARACTHTHTHSCLIKKEGCQDWMKNILNGLRGQPSMWLRTEGLVADVKWDYQQEYLSPFTSLNFTHVHVFSYHLAMTSKFLWSAMTSFLSCSLVYPCTYSTSTQRWQENTSISTCEKLACDLSSCLVLFQVSLPQEIAPSPIQLYHPKSRSHCWSHHISV